MSVGNKKLGNQCSSGNYYIFTELIEDVMEQVYKVEFGGPDENARHAARDDMILKWRCNSDIGASALQREDCFTLFLGGGRGEGGQLSLGAHFSPGSETFEYELELPPKLSRGIMTN